mmetsp:Transcript_76943/g.243139  ORF Transcript_76943/g.243139 Transcript_76943/m.243139 type:complete len:407 (-) Transcript_76943:413-1633(-)
MADLLLIDSVASADLCNLAHDLFAALLALLVAGVQLEALLESLEGLVVLLHEEVRGALSGVGLHERGVQLQALIEISQRIWVCQQVGEGCSSVGVELDVLRIPLDCLVVLRLGIRPVLGFEELVALLSMDLRLGRVHVALLLKFVPGPLTVPEGIPGVPVVILREGLLVKLDGFVVLLPLLVNGRHAGKDLCDLLERRPSWVRAIDLIPPLDEVLARLQDLVVVLFAHLDPHRTPVVVVSKVVRHLFHSLVIHLQRLLELLLLVQLIALGLELVRLLLLGSPAVRRRRRLLLPRLLGGRRGGAPGSAQVLGLRRAHLDALHGHEDLKQALVLLQHLHEQRRIHLAAALAGLHDQVELLHELLVLQVLLDLGAPGCGHRQCAGVEASQKPSARARSWDLVLGIHGLL